MDISGNLRVRAIAETAGLLLNPIYSAEGGAESAIINLNASNNPSQNPLLTKGMLWINKAQTVGGWTAAASLGGTRSRCGGAALGGKFYVVGGGNGPPPSFDGALLAYDPPSAAWSTLQSMNYSRGFLAVSSLGGKIYAAGDRWLPTC